MKRHYLAAALLGGVSGAALSFVAPAFAQTRSFNVPAEDGSKAISDLAQQAGIQIIAPGRGLHGITTPAVVGNYDVHTALDMLLKGTNVQVASDSGATIILTTSDSPKNAEAASNEAAKPGEDGIETITVTAEKRAESEIDVPMAMTALSGESLTRSQSLRFEDYVGTVPGLTLIQSSENQSQLVIRGLTTGLVAISGTVATYVDETPFTAEGPFAGSAQAGPNLDTFDMARIEVLKGPQGTLYGANAMGGLLKFVTNAPDPAGFAATVQAGVSTVDNGGAGFDLHGMVNVPVSDDAAFRFVIYENFYPGFIDDPSRGLKDINQTHEDGGRLSFLYEPTNDFSIRLSALYQVVSSSDINQEDAIANADGKNVRPLYGPLISELTVAEPSDEAKQVYNATVNYDFGWGRLLSTTSYIESRVTAIADLTAQDGAAVDYYTGTNVGVGLTTTQKFSDVTEEVRLASPSGQDVTWQGGAFYTREVGDEFEKILAVDPTAHAIDYGFYDLGTYEFPLSYREFAAFGDVDWHITPTFDVEAGGRYSHNDQTFHEVGTGLLGCYCNFGHDSSEGVFTWSGDARWHITPAYMLYARIASGFVPGGPNDEITTHTNLPASYNSSTITNYEIGLKSSLLDGHLTVEISAFDIAWRDIQLEAIIGTQAAVTNGGGATSKGVEWAFDYAPITGLTLRFNGAYTDAYLTQNVLGGAGLAGNQLPAVPFWAGSLSANYERPVFADYSGFAGLTYRYGGSRFAEIYPVPPRVELPSYGIVDIRGGIENANWTLALYARNVGNAIALNYTAPYTLAYNSGPLDAFLYTPRTIGMELTARF